MADKLYHCGYLVHHANKLNKYGSKPDEAILKLSDLFPENADSDIEVKCRMIKVNYGRSTKSHNACKPLKEYAWIVEQV